jgi:cell cycle checkpoint protein
VTQKENALLLFHLMGKIMHNKRSFASMPPRFVKLECKILTGKGDPPVRSASAKDIARNRELDRSLEDPLPLPQWLAVEERRTSRVDVNVCCSYCDGDGNVFLTLSFIADAVCVHPD